MSSGSDSKIGVGCNITALSFLHASKIKKMMISILSYVIKINKKEIYKIQLCACLLPNTNGVANYT
jgi:hypothetical protein